jgi:hypothetical protein
MQQIVAASTDIPGETGRFSGEVAAVGYASDRAYWCRWRSRQVPVSGSMASATGQVMRAAELES